MVLVDRLTMVGYAIIVVSLILLVLKHVKFAALRINDTYMDMYDNHISIMMTSLHTDEMLYLRCYNRKLMIVEYQRYLLQRRVVLMRMISQRNGHVVGVRIGI
jgi:hypothetical protein